MAELKIFLTNLGKYNEGELIGEWVDLPVDEDELQEVFKRIGISDEPDEEGRYYEEYFITDYESDIPGLSIGEYENLDNLNELAESIQNMDDYDLEIFKNAVEAGFVDADDIVDFDPDRFILYRGVYSDDDLGRTIIDEQYGGLSEMPKDVLEDNFDFEGYGRDFRLEWDPYSWLDGMDEDEVREQYGVDEIGDVDVYDYFGVYDDDDLGRTIAENVGELSTDTLESYFDFGSYASDFSRYAGAYTEDGFLEDTER